MLAIYVHNLSPDLIRFTERIGIHWYGLAYVLGFYFCYLVMHSLAKRGYSEIKPDSVADLITGTALFGVVLGGRLGYMLLYSFQEFIHHPLIFFRISDGGMASHGGIAGVALYLLYYARKHKISWVGIGDTIVCGAPLGLLTGRIANFINGELFGRVTTHPWAMKFPTEVNHQDFLNRYFVDHGEQFPFLDPMPQHSPDILAAYSQHFGSMDKFTTLLYPRHPSQLYEAFGEGLLLTVVLYTIRVKFPKLPHGILTGLFFLLYALVRIALENVREPDSGSTMILGLTKGQFFSTFMIAIGLAFLLYGLIARRYPATAKTQLRR
ncbi:MAG: Prolipoprotein diacylglyceryl transferase [Verrucomicrobiaceae bacterium]|nr:Prolipoprotein diacylglyceryl transferase [Verrucomicrobiaceae bacterium]